MVQVSPSIHCTKRHAHTLSQVPALYSGSELLIELICYILLVL